jgi:hypothetical protein
MVPKLNIVRTVTLLDANALQDTTRYRAPVVVAAMRAKGALPGRCTSVPAYDGPREQQLWETTRPVATFRDLTGSGAQCNALQAGSRERLDPLS